MEDEQNPLSIIIISMLIGFSLVLWAKKINDEKEIKKESEIESSMYTEVE